MQILVEKSIIEKAILANYVFAWIFSIIHFNETVSPDIAGHGW